MEVNFKNIISEISVEKSASKKKSLHSTIIDEISKRYTFNLKNIPLSNNLSVTNSNFTIFLDWCSDRLNEIQPLIQEKVPNSDLLEEIQARIKSRQNRISKILIKEISFDELKNQIAKLAEPDIELCYEIVAFEIPIYSEEHFDEQGAPKFKGTEYLIQKLEEVDFNYHSYKSDSGYSEYSYFRFEYLKLYIRWVFETPGYANTKKKVDYSLLLFLLKLSTSKLDKLKAEEIGSSITFEGKPWGGREVVSYGEGVSDKDKNFENIKSGILANFHKFFDSPITTEISMIEQLREYLILKEDLLLKSQSTFIKEESFKVQKERIESGLLKSLNHLKEKGLIHPNTSINEYNRVFSGEKVYKRIEWTSSPTLLKYFINYLIEKNVIEEPPRKQKWEIVSKCFQLVLNGEDYSYKKYKTLKKPSTTSQKLIRESVRAII